MTTLLENPMPVILIGILVEAFLAFALVTTRRAKLLWAMAAALVLVVAGVLVERLVVTPRERVEQTLYGAAAAIEANDLRRVERYIAREPGDVLSRARYYMAGVDFHSVRISGLRVQINRLTSPPTAEARFDGVARFNDRSGTIPYQSYYGSFLVDLVEEEDGWKVEDVRGDPQKPLGPRG